MDNTTLEQYKSYVIDLGNIGARYATTNGFYLSVVSALLGILAFVGTGKALNDIQPVIMVGVPAFGCVVCWIWYKTNYFYSSLFAAKFAVLRKMEEVLSFKPYTVEREILKKQKLVWLARNERKVPFTLGILFAAIALTVLFSMLNMHA
jgi:amino acid transporter